MAVSMKDLGIDQLSVEDRLSLVHEIWDRIAAQSVSPALTDEQEAELDRRCLHLDANPDDVVD